MSDWSLGPTLSLGSAHPNSDTMTFKLVESTDTEHRDNQRHECLNTSHNNLRFETVVVIEGITVIPQEFANRMKSISLKNLFISRQKKNHSVLTKQ